MLRRSFLVFMLVSTFAIMGCKITGKITNDKGVGIEGITIELSGDASMSTSTDAGGIYVFRKINNGTYTVTPFDAENEYAFEPGKKEVKIDRKKKIARADFKAVTSPSPSLPPPWSNYQGNAAHTGYVPVSLPGNLSEDPIWTKIIVESVPLNPVAVGDGKVFVTTLGYFGPNIAVCLDSADGTELWRYDFDQSKPTDPIHSINPPAYANGTVIIQSGGYEDSFLWAFDAESEPDDVVFFRTPYENRWLRYYAPTIYGGNVYVGGGETGGVYGFEGVLEGEPWFWDLSASDQWTPAVNEDHVIAYTGIFATDAGLTVIHRLDGETWTAGEVDFVISDPNFEFDFASENHLDLAPVLGSQDNVIVIQGGRLISFDLTYKEDDEAEDGNKGINWEKEGGFSGQPSLANGVIYAVYEGELHALNEEDGSFIEDWKPWQPPKDESIDAPMIVTDNLIFVSTASTTYAIDLEKQKEEWSYSAGGHLAISDDGLLFIATTDGRLIAINLY